MLRGETTSDHCVLCVVLFKKSIPRLSLAPFFLFVFVASFVYNFPFVLLDLPTTYMHIFLCILFLFAHSKKTSRHTAHDSSLQRTNSLDRPTCVLSLAPPASPKCCDFGLKHYHAKVDFSLQFGLSKFPPTSQLTPIKLQLPTSEGEHPLP